MIHRVVFDELCEETFATSRDAFVAIIARMAATQDAEAVVLGCTEIAPLLEACLTPIPTFDTARLHAEGAVNWAAAPDAAI